ncbi:acetate kinase [Synechococcus sp. PCC 7335]|uniref:acetate/propionate family kinase n=1 Tax=Synechococcus sp. (strain ATCC 29403 / PCC 7335) TaxID=91464 RepID=UPI00017EC73B|nr:acetate kinase [Synechococcus sp. PCC 7335]EDX87824.1 acetate kinase [Synechococcus sp. PCC 7335]
MKIFVLNAGSSSQKSALYEIPNETLPGHPSEPLWEGQLDWTKENSAQLVVKSHTGEKHSETIERSSRKESILHLLGLLHHGPTKVISELLDIDVVGHRVVHGGADYQSSVTVTPTVKQTIHRLISLAPNHNPANLEGIELMEQLLPDIPQVAVFDTAFHSQMPSVASIYPGPYDWVEQGIRRYGFHGISHQYCTQKASQILEQALSSLRLITCHLGNGGSLAAVKNGKSIDTTMGFTPLDGLMMGTRSGAVDPGILIHLMRQGMSVDELDQLLNKASGLLGVSGVSHDLRAVQAEIQQNNKRAQLAKDLYLYRLKACIGSMIMALGGVDVIAFTGGIGENAAWLRLSVCESMEFLGLQIDNEKNNSLPTDIDIATCESKVRVLVIHTQEDWAIAQECWQLVKGERPKGR